MASRREEGLYDPRNEHDACGVGFVANIKGRKSHDIIRRGLQILVNLDHRGAVGADPLVGDGAGCMIQMPDGLLRDWAEERGLESAAARPLCGGDVFSADGRSGARRRGRAFRAFRRAPRGRAMLAWREVGVDTTGLGKTVIETMPYIAQAIVARRSRHPRPGPVRAQDPDDPQAGSEQRQSGSPRSTACRRCGSSTSRPSRPARSSTRACCWRRRSRAFTTICATR